MMVAAVISGFVVGFLAPWIVRAAGDSSKFLLALLPASLFVYFLSFLPEVAEGEVFRLVTPWTPGLDLMLSFYVDGLSLTFTLLISGIGAFIVLYAGSYLHGHPQLGRFYLYLLSFMAAMLGLVLADNIVTLYVFWELTSITSFLLIGFNHEAESSRKKAVQALLVTAGGGLALLAGLVMMATVVGSYELSEILANPDVLQDHAHYTAFTILVLASAFSKSAQVPLHFWLPNAMEAPTPVSAYLHSSTMVKAGIYLLARMHPGLGGTDLWVLTLSIFGGLTMFTGAFLAIQNTEIKKVLAYSTIMALGTLTMLIGIGTEGALIAAAAFLLAHALYKASLFLVAGILDHETGTKDIAKMGGLRHAMPVTAIFTCLAALSFAGLPPFFGFLAKELMLESVLEAQSISFFLATLSVLAAMFTAAVAGIVAWRPFFGRVVETPKHPHDPPLTMLLGPIVLASLALILGIFPSLAAYGVVTATAQATFGEPVEVSLYLWHGLNLPLILSLISLTAAFFLVRNWDRLRAGLAPLQKIYAYGPEAGYWKALDGLNWIAAWQTRIIQHGYLRIYVAVTILVAMALTLHALVTRGRPDLTLDFSDVAFHELAVAAILVLASGYVAFCKARLAAVASLGIVGFGVTLTFVLYSAPDLAVTQILVETLTVILLVLVLFRLPGYLNLSSASLRLRDMGVALLAGGTLTVLVLAAVNTQYFEPISWYFIEKSVPQGQGYNIVNVILVDFRALDTLGEIYVLALAAIGVYAMIKFRSKSETR